MRGYRFRLEPVLRVRQLQEERARASLAMARRAEAEARSDSSRRRGLFAAARAAGLPDGSRLAWSQERDRQERLASALLASQMAEAHAADMATRELGHWEEAVVALRTLERLDERKREEFRAEQGRAEQKVLDELVNARTANGRSRGAGPLDDGHLDHDRVDDDHLDNDHLGTSGTSGTRSH